MATTTGYLDITEQTVPATPAASHQRLYIDSTTHLLKVVNSSGTASNVGAAAAFSGCFAYNSGTQSFNATTLTTITFDSELYDTASYHNTGANTGRLVAPVTGYYRVEGNIWYASTSGINYALLEKNTSGAYIRGGAWSYSGVGSAAGFSTVVNLTASDYLTLVGYHTQAGSIATGDSGSTPSQQNWFAMTYLGS